MRHIQHGQQLREPLHARYQALLERDESPLVNDPDALAQTMDQLDSVLTGTALRLGLPIESKNADVALQLSADIGRRRAQTGVDPSQSLHAACLMFEVALPEVTTWLETRGDEFPLMSAATTLNRAIMERMGVAASLYVDSLLTKVLHSHSDERRRLSRELHDVAAPAIAVALQNLDLHELYAAADPGRAAEKLGLARQAMLDALTTLRELSAESRESVGRNGLEYAIARSLDRSPPGIASDLTVSGDVARLPAVHREELFLLVREAIRNAFTHAQAKHVAVHLGIEDGHFLATIRDDGRGFDPGRAGDEGRSLGLVSMRERAELLGGKLVISSDSAAGTTVTAQVPLPAEASLSALAVDEAQPDE